MSKHFKVCFVPGSNLRVRLTSDLEHRPQAVKAAIGRGAIEIAGGQAGHGVKPAIAVQIEAVQDRFRPAPTLFGRELEHRPVKMNTTGSGRTVEVASRIEDYAGSGLRCIAAVRVKLCRTVSVQPPPSLGDNSNTVPSP